MVHRPSLHQMFPAAPAKASPLSETQKKDESIMSKNIIAIFALVAAAASVTACGLQTAEPQ